MQTLWQALRYGARMLMKQSGYMLIAVFIATYIFLHATSRARQQCKPAPVIHPFKTIGSESLKLHVFMPAGAGKKRAAVVLFHGGGFVWGDPSGMTGIARDYVAQGIVAIAAQYRLSNRGCRWFA
jgi:acetyl esterase